MAPLLQRLGSNASVSAIGSGYAAHQSFDSDDQQARLS